MKKNPIIYFAFFSLIAACAPSNIKMVETTDRSKKVNVKFEGYKKIKLKKTKGFGSTTLYILSMPLLEAYNGGLFSVSFDKYGIKENARFYADIPECSLSYNTDSTILYAKGGVRESYYLISRQLENGYNINLSSFGVPENIPMPMQETSFLEKLILSVSILDK